MVERVERAIIDAMNADPRGGSFSRAAYAAIKAMREPTEAMADAGYEADGYDVCGRIWTAMIDAAINEGKEGE